MIQRTIFALATVGLLSTLAQAQEIGARAKGGFAESFFIEKVPQAEAQATAQRLAKAVIAARMIIFRMPASSSIRTWVTRGSPGKYSSANGAMRSRPT
ncbi:MAG: hypothetical protein IPG13_10605 [Rhodocyclaceae bacterium]|nr:hypothetical protein [Rhodocyclaceae bacterium]